MVYTDESGFYVIRLNDKFYDSEGKYSEEGYRFNVDHKIKLSVVPNSNKVFSNDKPLTGSYVTTTMGHNFTKLAMDLTMKKYYSNAITIANCLLNVK